MKTNFPYVGMALPLLFCFVLSADVARAATYYVAKNGSNVNSCAQAQSSSTPKSTVNGALGCLIAGDTLLVRGGVYDESISSMPSGTSWTNKIRVAAYPGETVWLQPSSGAWVINLHLSEQYIEFDGINVNGSRVDYDTIKIECWTNSNAHHIRFKNLDVTGSGFSGEHSQGILLTAGLSTCVGSNEFLNVSVHGTGRDDFDHGFYIQSSNNLLDGCTVYDIPGAGIHLYNGYGVAFSGVIVRNTVVRDLRTTASGQRHYGIEIANGATGTQVYNNIVSGVPTNGSGSAGIYVFAGSSTSLYNNTVSGNANEGIRIEDGVSGTVVRNNIIYQNNGGNFNNFGSNTAVSNNMLTDPKFVDAASRNFRLQSGSGAIDAGVALSNVTTDISGTARPQGSSYDIGAFEFATTISSAPAPPKNVRVIAN